MVATAATFFNPLFLHTHGRVNIWALSRISYLSGNVKSRFPIYRSEIHHQVHYFSHLAPICETFKEPMGFGPAPKKRKKSKMRRDYDEDDDDEEQEKEEEPDRGVIPEVVTNRMMSRMAVSVGIPLGIGLFFPIFLLSQGWVED
ncbi:hypothetical protein JHK87_025093 [Glycine soja]|nr:hypothetical protein JHK87_025093 [Glycine soja]